MGVKMFTNLVLGSLMLALFMGMLNSALESINEDNNNEIVNIIQCVLIFICNLTISVFLVFFVINILVK